MSIRAMWKGILVFGDHQVPVKYYSAIEDRRVHFRLLHRETLVPLKRQMINPKTGESVDHGEAKRGYEVEAGKFVVFDPEELELFEPEESRRIEITRFVEPDRIDSKLYDRPYYLAPDEDATSYFSLVDALTERDKIGIARWVMRKRSYIGALRAQDGYLVMLTLRDVDETIHTDQLEPPPGRALDPRERELGQEFIDRLEADFDPDDYEDQYRQRVLELIEAKKDGQSFEVEPYETKSEERGSLLEALEASLRKE